MRIYLKVFIVSFSLGLPAVSFGAGQVRTPDIVDGAVTTPKLAAGAATGVALGSDVATHGETTPTFTGNLRIGSGTPLTSTTAGSFWVTGPAELGGNVFLDGLTGPALLWVDSSHQVHLVVLGTGLSFNTGTSTLSAGGPAAATGSLNTLPKVTIASPLTYADSMITDDGSTVSVTGAAAALNGQPAPAPVSSGPGTAATNSLTVSGGPGGNTTDVASTVGGVGAPISITAGSGGTAPSGSTNGAGGAVTINGGVPGAGAGTAGATGNVLLQTTGGKVGIGITPAFVLDLGYGSLNFTTLTTPVAPSVVLNTDSTANQLPAGVFSYKVTYTTSLGNTPTSTASGNVTADGTHTSTTVTIPVNAQGQNVTGRTVYRNEAGGSSYFQACTVADNTTTSITDLNVAGFGWTHLDATNHPDAPGAGADTNPAPTATLVSDGTVGRLSNGAYTYKVTYQTALGETAASAASNSVTVDSTHTSITLSVLPISLSGSVARRRVYRTKAGGTYYYFVAAVAGNVTTTFTDTLSDAQMTAALAAPSNDSSTGYIVANGTKVANLSEPSAQANISIGQFAGVSLTGNNNVAIGNSTMGVATSAATSVALGAQALKVVTTGQSNFGLGFASLQALTTGSGNVGLGIDTLLNQTIAGQNVAIGTFAGEFFGGTGNLLTIAGIANSSDNVSIGFDASVNNSQSVFDTFIGPLSDVLSPGGTGDGVNIGNGNLTATLSNSSANLGIGVYKYLVTFVLNGVEGPPMGAAVSKTTTSGNQQINLTSVIPYFGPSVGTVGRNVYRTDVGGTIFHRLSAGTTIADATTTTFTDNFSDATIDSNPALSATLGYNHSIALGKGALITASNQMAIGSLTDPISQVYIGNGVYPYKAANAAFNNAGQSVTINASGGTGTDQVGGNLGIAGGPGTGAGAGGDIPFSTAPAGSTGAVANALVERMRIKSGGATGPTASATQSLIRIGSTDIAGGNASGTFIGLNAPSGYAGDLENWQVNGVSQSKTDASGNLTIVGKAIVVGTVNTGGVKVHRTTVASGAYSVLVTDYYIVLTGTTGGTFTLPLAATAGAGAVFIIKDGGRGAASSNLTLARSGSDTIDGATSLVFTVNGQSAMLISDGVSNYEVN